MLNIEDFIKRLEYLMDYYSLNASLFADKIGVQRSSISHLLSGRNKPSLDFILKITEEFPSVDLYWILNGEGNFLKTNTPTPILERQKIEDDSGNFSDGTSLIENNKSVESSSALSEKIGEKEIFKIVVLYKDGSFRDFKPGE